MHGFLLRLGGALALCLMIGLGALPARALSGPEIAHQLNQAITSTPERCVGNRAAYFCSGAMVKQVLPTDPQPFWSHGPDAIARGAERFDYLRRDVTLANPLQNNGFILADRFTAMGQGKDYQLQGDDGMNRPPELLVSNWGNQAPDYLPVRALFHLRSVAGLKAALRDQRVWFQATGEWLPILRLDPTSPDEPFGFDQREQMYNGYRLAAGITARYEDTSSTCRNGKSALHCNSVIIRGTGYGTGFKSWNPTQNSQDRDGVSFSVVRKDVGTVNIVGSEGLIFHELGRPLDEQIRFRCLYPANAGTSSIPNSCRATCLSQGINSVASWRARYGSNPGQSCTFMDTPAEVQLNTDVRQGQSWATAHNELIIGAWDQNIPKRLPIEVFFYRAAGLAGARYIQNDFLQETGIFVPVLKVQLADPVAKFVFNVSDQSY